MIGAPKRVHNAYATKIINRWGIGMGTAIDQRIGINTIFISQYIFDKRVFIFVNYFLKLYYPNDFEWNGMAKRWRL